MLYVSLLRSSRGRLVADGRRLASLCRLPVGDLGDGGHDLRRHAAAVGELVCGRLVRVDRKQGVSALGLQRVLGLGSYQTAWAWLHKLRRAMVLLGRELLTDAV